jgi:hypothetical protein
MSTYYSHSDVEKYTDLLNHRLTDTDYHAVFGSIADDGSFIPKDEGEGIFLLMDETGTVLPYDYGDDIERALEETPEMIVAYAKG